MYKSTAYFERFTQRFNYPVHILLTASPRKVLFGINLILAICSLCIAGVAIFLCNLLFDPVNPAGMFAAYTLSAI